MTQTFLSETVSCDWGCSLGERQGFLERRHDSNTVGRTVSLEVGLPLLSLGQGTLCVEHLEVKCGVWILIAAVLSPI